MIEPKDVVVRAITEADLPAMVRYFFESSPEYLNGIGMKARTRAEAQEFERRWLERISSGERYPAFAVNYRDELVGFHTSTHFSPGESLIMHAHFVAPALRGLGIGTISYVKAMEKFFAEFDVRKILFKTPIQNRAPMRIKEKLGLLPVGEEIIDWPVLVRPLPTKVFEVTRAQLPDLRRRAGL